MRSFRQTSEFVGEYSDLPFWRKSAVWDLACVAYGLVILALVMGSYILAAFGLFPANPEEINLSLVLAPPGTPGHLLGTDYMGRDTLARLVTGIRAYFFPGLLSVAIALVLGTILGVLSGYRGGAAERAVTYLTNLVDSFPRLVLMLLVVAAFKPDIWYIMVVLGLTSAPAVSLLVKDKIRFLRHKNFIEAATALGLSDRAIIGKHILWYNCRSLLIIQATLGMAEAVLVEVSLSYLGFGVQEPTPSWGNMVQAGSNYLLQGNIWPSTVPALAILLTILGFHLLGDGLNGILERRSGR